MKAGRPTVLTDAITQKLCEEIEAGNTFSTSCRTVGVAVRSFYHWRRTGKQRAEAGKDESDIFVRFYHAIDMAEAKAERAALEVIRNANTWQAAAWYLERRYPDKWGSQRREIRELQRTIKQLTDNRSNLP